MRVGRRSGSKEARGDVMKGGGGDAVLSAQNDGSVVVPPARRTFRVAAEGAAPFAAMLAVLVVAVFGTAAYKHHRGKAWTDPQTTVLEMVTQRTFDKQRGASQQCETCAVVLPTEAYAGRKMGRRIDEADCVVRFNDHHPTAASAQDVGSKDDVLCVCALAGGAFLASGGHDAIVRIWCVRRGECVRALDAQVQMLNPFAYSV